MTQERREWIVEGADGASAHDLARHVVSRVGTVVRNQFDRYDGVKVHHGNVVFGGAHESHLLSVICGRDEVSGRLAIRVQVQGNLGARWAVVVFPAVTLVTLITCAKFVGGAPGLLGGLVLGLVLGALAGFATFSYASRLAGARGDRGRMAGIAGTIHRALEQSLSSLDLRLTAADTRFNGFDGATETPDAAWSRVLDDAVGALAG